VVACHGYCVRNRRQCTISWNPTGPTRTRTPTLGMCLSCNFVSVYMIVYHVQYTYTSYMHARIPNGHPREEKRACRTKVKIAAVDFNKMTSKLRHSTGGLLAAMFVGEDLPANRRLQTLNASAVLIGRKKSIEYNCLWG